MASPFHRPPPFQFPRGPPSPPDTNSDSIFPGMPVPMLSTQPLSGQDFGLHDIGLSNPSADMPGSRLRKSSSIPYHPTGLRDNKDRASSSQLRSGKPLIIVIPPSNLLQERGQAQIVTSGPYNRLSQGIVMPLFPSMFGQLTAIAREFNFPSTSGLCLYFHYTEDGFTLTPRISDDSWQSLWGHLSDPPLLNERRPLINGKIEFDIDHRLARWYGPWVSTIHRELSDASQHYPYTAPSHGHFRGESRTTITDGRFFDDDAGENSAIQQHSAPVTRHAPRKLSLVERFESPSARPDIKPTPRALGTPPEYFPNSSQVLSPIVQEDEPKSARQDLNSRVKSWRASAQLSPTPLAATGQTSLEPPNLPNSMTLDPTHEVEVEELNMEDFTWSISSAGPQSPGEVSPISWARVPSVHLDSRLEGSVCSTPSIQTSCGPPDYDPFSLESVESLRVSSPDIAHRFYEDRPDTPLTATTWGAPLSYPPSPMSMSRVVSPDIAQRFYENVPGTPMTATSWGAPLSYPPSPMCLSPVPSLDLGERSVFDDVQRQFDYRLFSSSQANSSLSTQPWAHVWPYAEHSQATPQSTSSIGPNNAGAMLNAEISSSFSGPWSHVWPYAEHRQATAMSASFSHHSNANARKDSVIWPHVWPYNSTHSVSQGEVVSSMASSTLSHQWTFGYPYIHIYRPQYPYFDIYPSIVNSHPTEQEISLDMGGYPHNLRDIYSAVSGVQKIQYHGYPHNLNNIYPIVTRTEQSFTEEIRDKGYPHNLSQIYVAIMPRGKHPLLSRSQENEQGYPYNLDNIYPATIDIEAYPHNLDHIYSAVTSRSKMTQDTVLYPSFNLYPPILAPFFGHLSLYMYGPKTQYPEFDIYPESPVHSSIRRPVTPSETYAVGRSSYSVYPNFNLYPPVYPFFDLYPSITSTFEQSGPISLGNQKLSLNTTLAGYYPIFNIYPAVYPHFDIYPAFVNAEISGNIHKNTSTITLAKAYPFFNLYPNIYPFLEIYPAAYGSFTTTSSTTRNLPRKGELRTLKPSSPSIYPYFNLYPVIYPYLDIYPVPYGIEMKAKASQMNLVVEYDRQVVDSLQATYPYFNLYPTIYPYFDLYPDPYLETHQTQTVLVVSKNPRPVVIQAIAQYPIFNLYPAVYPYFDLYPSLQPEIPTIQQKKKSKPSSRLTHAELHAMVMMEKVGSTGSFSHMDSMGRLGENEIHISRPGSFSSQECETDSRFDLPGHLASVRKIHASSSTQSPEIRRISMAFKPGPSSLLQSLTPDPNLLPARSSQLPHPSQGLRPLVRSGSLQEPNVPLPPRPNSIAVNRSRIPPPIPPKPSPRKRDSLVLQRIKAYDNTGKDHRSSFIDLSDNDGPLVELTEGSTKDTLSKFPMPPKIPLPPLPMDRTL